jgi:peptide/nickel transport system permease protein
MIAYVLRKVLLAIPLVWGVLTLTFLLIEAAPGDAADHFLTPETPPEVRDLIMKKWGLDQPVYVRYVRMMGNLATGDFGRSIAQERPVFDIIKEALPITLMLSSVDLCVILIVGMTLGVLQAVRQYSLLDNVLSIGSLFFYSMPEFWLALMLMLLFGVKLAILPISGIVDPMFHDSMSLGGQIWDRVRHIILPGVALGVAASAATARYMRSSVLEVIRQDYIRTAQAKGLRESVVIVKHALRNALLPIITIVALSMPYLFSGSVLVEIIFAWPGMGRLIVGAILNQDTPLVLACFFVYAILIVIANLVADILYAVADPRIRYS